MSLFKAAFPGVALCFFVALPANALGKTFPIFGAPIFAIIIGMILKSFLPNNLFKEGIAFTSKKILQYSIIMLGFGMNLFEILKVGSESIIIILSTITAALLTAYFVGKLFKLDHDVTTLIGVGSSICGGSAIAAAAPVIKASDEDIAKSISVIFFFNVIAAFIFPMLGVLLNFNDIGFGMWAGTAINDTSSVVAAGETWANFSGSNTALNYATIVKLTRTLAIIPICLGLAYLNSKREKNNVESTFKLSKIFPMFILYFILAAIFNTFIGKDIESIKLLPDLGKFMITMAMGAIGLNTNFIKLVKTGGSAIVLGLICWIVISLISLFIQYQLNIW